MKIDFRISLSNESCSWCDLGRF